MPLETLGEPNVRGMVIERPKLEARRFNPFKDLGRGDYDELVRSLKACFSWVPPPDSTQLGGNFEELHVLYPQFRTETETLYGSIPQSVLINLREEIQKEFRKRDWDLFFDDLVQLKRLEPSINMYDYTMPESAWSGLRRYLASTGEDSDIRIRSNFRLAWPRRFAEFFAHEDAEEKWIHYVEEYKIKDDLLEHIRQYTTGKLIELRIIYPEQFKRDIKFTAKEIDTIRRESDDYDAALLSADDIRVDDGGIHLLFEDNKFEPLKPEPLPSKLKF